MNLIFSSRYVKIEYKLTEMAISTLHEDLAIPKMILCKIMFAAKF